MSCWVFAQTHVHWVGDAIQPSHPLLPPSPILLNLSQHQGLFQWVSSSHQVAKALASVLRMNIQGRFPLGLTDLIFLLSKIQIIYYKWRKFWAIQKGKFFLSYPHLQPTSQMCNSLHNILQSVNDVGFSSLPNFSTKEMSNISLVAQVVKNPPAMCRLRFDPWVKKIPLEKEMATYSTILAWEIPWTEGPGQATVHGVTKSQTQLRD